MMKGTWTLCRHILRRDWLRILIWLVILGVFAVSIPFVFEDIFGTQAEQIALAETMKNPAMTALFGIGYGLDNYQSGQAMAHEMLLMTIIAVAIANIIMVVRHTRREEESARLELVAALPVGRMANMTATLLAAFLFNVLIVIEHVLFMTPLGIESMPFIGNLYYGLCIGIAGFFFAGVAAVFSQLTSTSRAATGLSMVVFGTSYMMRAIGDVGNESLSLISPLGLVLRAKPYVDENPLPLIILFGATIVLCLVAYALQTHRDLGAGVIAQRNGRSSARKALLSPFGLAWRLNRGTIIAWGIGLFLLGAMYGSVFGDMETFLNSSDFIKAAFASAEHSMTEEFLGMLMVVIALVSVIPGLFVALKLRSEEKHHLIENLATRNVSRAHIMTSYVILVVLCCVLMNVLSCLGLWVAIEAVMADPFSFQTILTAGMCYLPPMLVLCGLAFALIGVAPKAASLVWLLLGYGFFADYLAPLFQLDDWVSMASPFFYVKRLPVEAFDVVPLLVLSSIAIALTVIGYAGYRNRDLEG